MIAKPVIYTPKGDDNGEHPRTFHMGVPTGLKYSPGAKNDYFVLKDEGNSFLTISTETVLTLYRVRRQRRQAPPLRVAPRLQIG